MRSITSTIPLRDTTAWPGYRQARWIPHRYGVCGGEALQYDDTRQRFVWADHASAAVDQVRAGDQIATDWRWDNVVDVTGRVVTMITFVAAVPEGKVITARGRGKLHPLRGGAMNNAADVIWDALANVGGLALPAQRLAAFRQQAGELIVGGSIEQPDRLFEVARSICSSIGAVCSLDMIGFARLWPEFDGPAVATVDASDIDVDSRAELADICTDLTIRYAHEAGVPRGAVQYVVARAPSYGAQPAVIDAPWVSSSRVASLVCQRLLRYRARPQYEVSVQRMRGDLRIGQCVLLDHPLLPVSGTHMIQQRAFSVDDNGERSDIVLRAPAGGVPPLRLVRNTNASEPRPELAVTATPGASEIEVEILDQDTGAPLADAECTLDGQITRRADSAGIVRFPRRYATPGNHELVVVAPGRDPMYMTITVT